jgi:hypothetical protein
MRELTHTEMLETVVQERGDYTTLSLLRDSVRRRIGEAIAKGESDHIRIRLQQIAKGLDRILREIL